MVLVIGCWLWFVVSKLNNKTTGAKTLLFARLILCVCSFTFFCWCQKSLARQLHLWRLKHLCGENTNGNDDGLKKKGGWNYNGKNNGGVGDNAEDNETQNHLLGMDEIPFKSPR